MPEIEGLENSGQQLQPEEAPDPAPDIVDRLGTSGRIRRNLRSGSRVAVSLAATVLAFGLRSRIETTDPIDAFAGAVTCEDVSAPGFVDLFQFLTSGSAGAASNSETPPFSVSSTGPDTHTGIYVTQGQRLTTFFDGTWNTNVFDPNSGPVGAEGNSPNGQGDVNCRRVPGPTGGMILAIEGAYGSLAFTTPVRNGSTLTVQTTGYLDFFINERTDNFVENGKVRNCTTDNGGVINGRIVLS